VCRPTSTFLRDHTKWEVNIYITVLVAPGCRRPSLYYYRHRGFREECYFEIEKEEKEKEKKRKKKRKINFKEMTV